MPLLCFKTKKVVSYAESSGDEDEDVFVSMARNRAARRNKARSTVIDDDDDYDGDAVDNGDDDGSCITARLLRPTLLTDNFQTKWPTL